MANFQIIKIGANNFDHILPNGSHLAMSTFDIIFLNETFNLVMRDGSHTQTINVAETDVIVSGVTYTGFSTATLISKLQSIAYTPYYLAVPSGNILSIVQGENMYIDYTDPLNPVINAIIPFLTLQDVTNNGRFTDRIIEIAGLTITNKLDFNLNLITAERQIQFQDKDGIVALKDDIDSAIEGLNHKNGVRLAFDYNLANAGVLPYLTSFSQQGVTLASGDRVLVFGQTDQKLNGICYVGTLVSGQIRLRRTKDANASNELNNAIVPVFEGDYANKIFRQTTPNPAFQTGSTAVLLDNVVFELFTSGGGSTPTGKVVISDEAGSAFTDLATALSWMATQTTATITNASFDSGVFRFDVPSGSAIGDDFLTGLPNVQFEDKYSLFTTFGDGCCGNNTRNNIIGNLTVQNDFLNSSTGNNIIGNITSQSNFLNSSTGSNTIKKIVSLGGQFANNASGRLFIESFGAELPSDIITTTNNLVVVTPYANKFDNNGITAIATILANISGNAKFVYEDLGAGIPYTGATADVDFGSHDLSARGGNFGGSGSFGASDIGSSLSVNPGGATSFKVSGSGSDNLIELITPLAYIDCLEGPAHMPIAHTAKFGINTNAPTVALDVVGDIKLNGNSLVIQGVDNTTTLALTSAQLNTAYPTAQTGFKVYCTGITLGKMTYEKTPSGWIGYTVLIP